MINDLGFKRLRLVTYWKIGEPEEGTYDFSEFDWQMKLAEEKGVKVSLSLGLRQPRWPECHLPTWAMGKPVSEWEPQLKAYIRAIVERYKHSPALDSYQLENEYFLKVFGECPDFSRQRLVDEYNLVKSIDPDHTLVVSMSNNAIGTPIYAPTPDEWAISIYKRVWDKTLTKRYFEYPIPAWYYGFRAGWTELTRHRNSFIHELQAEAWVPDNLGTIKDVSVEEQDKSMDAARLHDRFEYGRATGMKTFDMWGVEWWYWRKQMKNDPSLWNAAKEEIAKTEAMNAGK
jgi:beta-galactosidase GanA